MSERKNPKPWQDAPPVNRAQACFRVIIWLLPTGFAVCSSWAGNWLISRGYLPKLGFGFWVVPNVFFMFGAAWYNALLSRRARSSPRGIVNRLVLFFLIQLFLMPLLLAILLYLACVIDPIQFGGH